MLARQDNKCPKCGGHMFIDKDIYGYYVECLQCSYTHELKASDNCNRQDSRSDDGPAGEKTVITQDHENVIECNQKITV